MMKRMALTESGIERIGGGKSLREMSGTGHEVLCEECSVALAITVGEEEYLCAN